MFNKSFRHAAEIALLVTYVLLLAACGTVQEQAENAAPEEVPYRSWNLTDLYESSESWQAAYQALLPKISALSELEGTLNRNAEAMSAALMQISAVQKEAVRLYVYSSLKNDEDQRISESQERLTQSRSMFSAFSEATSWIQPEVLAIGADRVKEFMAENINLAPFDFYLLNILSNAEHTLGAEAENVLAAAGIVLDSPNEIYELLVNADIPWPTIVLSTGEKVLLNQAGYGKYRAAANREDRILVFDTFWKVWQEYKDSIGSILATEVNSNVLTARLRHYDSALQMQLSEEKIPTQVYDTLVAEVNSALPTLYRYFRLRGRMLGVEQMHYYDIYPPLIELDLEFDLAKSREITLEALKPLGSEYTEPMRAVTDSTWLHVYPQPGKRSGAYMNGSAYDVHPYVLLNHTDDFNSMSTYAHELGHAVHTLLTTESQPFEKSDYSTFIAEIASQINEILLEEYMIEHAQSKEEKLYYLGYALESMRGSFFRQTMFAEFEQAIHEAVEAGEPLSGERMNTIYGDLLRRYHGTAEGVMEIDDTYSVEWAYIPHFYYDFYVYQYSTSIAGAAWFAERLLAGDAAVQQAFIKMLRAGGSDYPYNLLVAAGLDMASPEPYRAAVRRMDSVMDRIEALLNE